MLRSLFFVLFALLLVVGLAGPARAQAPAADRVVAHYARIVHRAYADAHADAVGLQAAIGRLLDAPTPARLERAKRAWLRARASYGPTEAFRFYGGPIDGIGPAAGLAEGEEGPEGRLNAWPLNEAYIDYVKGRPEAGIVSDPSVEITRATLVEKNAREDEADVTTGYHAIEFLLWGQDLNPHGPGHRPVSDYAKTADNARRRAYLREVTDLLVDDLALLVDQWAPGKGENFRARFVAAPPAESLGRILTGLATLAGFELASERIAVPLDSGDQEDEHSCFADNTHADYVGNAEGIAMVYFGRYRAIDGPGIHDLLAARDAPLAGRLAGRLRDTVAATKALEPPVDRILASEPGSAGREALEQIVDRLYTDAEMLLEAAETLEAPARIAGE